MPINSIQQISAAAMHFDSILCNSNSYRNEKIYTLSIHKT